MEDRRRLYALGSSALLCGRGLCCVRRRECGELGIVVLVDLKNGGEK
jgi:hypothetical protein